MSTIVEPADSGPIPPEPAAGGAGPAATPTGSAPVVSGEFPPAAQGWYAVSVLALCTTFAMLDQGILSLLIQQIIADFQLTDTQASLLLGPAFAFVYVVVGIPLSPLIDRWTRTKIIAVGITVWSLA